MVTVLILLGAVLPLLIAPGLMFHYDTASKTLVLELAAAAALIRFRAVPEDLAQLRSRRAGVLLLWMALAETTWFGIATAFSSRPWFSLFGSGWREFGLITLGPLMAVTVLVAAHLGRNPHGVSLLLRATAVAGIAASAYGIAQYFDIDPLQSAAGYHAHAGDSVIVRPPGTLGHADYFAWWLAVEFFCGVALIRTEAGGWRRMGMAAAALTAIAAVLTGTRSALLAVAAGVLTLAIIGRFRIGRRHLAGATACGILLAVFFISPAGARLRARVAWAGEEPVGGGRPLLWRDSLRMAAARPLAGFGPETFSDAFGRYESEELANLYPDFHYESPHNLWLDAFASLGAPGLLLLAGWAGLAMYAGREALRSGSAAAAPLVAALVTSATAQLFCAATLAPVLLSLLVLAMLVSLNPAERRPGSGRFTWRGAIVCTGLAMASAAYAGALGVSEFALAEFQRQPSLESYLGTMRRGLPGAAEDIYAARMISNTCGQAGEPLLRLQCSYEAFQAARRAVTTAGDPANAWYNLAMFSAARDDAEGCRKALAGAIAAAPNWFKPHWMMSRLLYRMGQRAEAKAEGERAEWLDHGKDAEVAQTVSDDERSAR